ncbi:hypothetical protein [Moorena sp. SIO4G3]|uniref:ISAzo13-like element transposase-related protein n=1 Tax=Moorena sp. SIO4G3 TaxID=2607821 RepID=UPI00142BEBCE|nr:hypothetical protein [Moorena sp. SIO4G3]
MKAKSRLLCDSGGSNGYRVRNWKLQLQEKLADPHEITVMVCHYPSRACLMEPN